MKKFINLFVAAAMIFSLITNAVTASAESEDFDYVADILQQLGIAEHEVFYEPQSEIKRTDFALLVANLRGFDRQEVSQSAFLDIDKEHYAASSIAYLKSLDIFNGYEDGTFRGEQTITYAEAAKVLVTLLGYETFALISGGWKRGYIEVSKSLKLNAGMSIGADAAITQEQAMRMIYNTLDANICDVEFDGTQDIRLVTDSAKTPMSEWLYLKKTKGVVKSVGNASITHDKTSENTMTIGSSKYYLGAFDLSYTLGHYCEVYYYADKHENEGTVVAASILPKKNDITVISTEDVSSFEGGILYYDKDSITGKVKITSSDEVVLNGQPVAAADRENVLLNSDGEILVNKLDEDGIGTVVMISSYDTYVVTSINKYDMMIYGRYGQEFKIDEEALLKVYDTSGAECEFEAIAVGNVLTVMKNSDGNLIEIYISDSTAEGEYKGNSEDNEKNYYTIGYDKYKLTKEYEKSGTAPIIGSKVTAYLDKFGRVAYISMSGSDFAYAYLCKMTEDETEDKVFIVKLYTIDGKFVTYYTADKLKIDNERPENTEGVIASIERGNEGESVNQLIRYKLNSENEISEIDTAYKSNNENPNSLRIIYKGYTAKGEKISSLVYKPNNSFEHKVVTGSNTRYITAAKTYEGNEKIFKTGRRGYVNGYSYALNAYCASETQLYPDIILDYSESEEAVDDEEYAVIRKVEETINEDDQPILKITAGTRKGAEVVYNTAEGELLDDITDKQGTHKIKAGDFVELQLNVLNEIVGVTLYYDNEHKEWQETNGFVGSFHNDNLSFGTAYKADGNVVQIALEGAVLGNDETRFSDMLRTYVIGGARIFTYDKSTGKVIDADATQIRAYYDGTAGASKVLISSDGATIGAVVIYR